MLDQPRLKNSRFLCSVVFIFQIQNLTKMYFILYIFTYFHQILNTVQIK